MHRPRGTAHPGVTPESRECGVTEGWIKIEWPWWLGMCRPSAFARTRDSSSYPHSQARVSHLVGFKREDRVARNDRCACMDEGAGRVPNVRKARSRSPTQWEPRSPRLRPLVRCLPHPDCRRPRMLSRQSPEWPGEKRTRPCARDGRYRHPRRPAPDLNSKQAPSFLQPRTHHPHSTSASRRPAPPPTR